MAFSSRSPHSSHAPFVSASVGCAAPTAHLDLLNGKHFVPHLLTSIHEGCQLLLRSWACCYPHGSSPGLVRAQSRPAKLPTDRAGIIRFCNTQSTPWSAQSPSIPHSFCTAPSEANVLHLASLARHIIALEIHIVCPHTSITFAIKQLIFRHFLILANGGLIGPILPPRWWPPPPPAVLPFLA